MGVRVPHLARPRGRGDGDDLVSRGYDPDPRDRRHRDPAGADRRGDADIPGREDAAPLEDDLPRPEVLSPGDHVLAGRHRAVYEDVVPDLLGVLDHHDRIGTARESAAGGDVLAGPRGDAPGIPAPHPHPAPAREHRRDGLGGPGGIGRGDCVAVDRRPVKPRYIAIGTDVPRKGPVEGIFERDILAPGEGCGPSHHLNSLADRDDR